MNGPDPGPWMVQSGRQRVVVEGETEAQRIAETLRRRLRVRQSGLIARPVRRVGTGWVCDCVEGSLHAPRRCPALPWRFI